MTAAALPPPRNGWFTYEVGAENEFNEGDWVVAFVHQGATLPLDGYWFPSAQAANDFIRDNLICSDWLEGVPPWPRG